MELSSIPPQPLKLDPEQEKAAAHSGGPALVIAGPGAGKTRTLVARYLRLVESGIPRESILVSTFTSRAADQLRERIAAAQGVLAPEDTSRMVVGTFHSICARLLRRFHAAAGLSSDFTIVDTAEQNAILSRLGVRWDGGENDLVDLISRWKDMMKSPGDAATEASVRGDRNLAEAAGHYEAYEIEKERQGVVDFADLISRTIDAMRREPRIRHMLQGRFLHLLVDEWQDVNPLQISLVKHLMNRSRNLFVIGDDDQSVYGWRGATVDYTVHFGRHFVNASTYRLSTNWRSEPAVVTASSALVSVNSRRVRKNLVAANRPTVADAVTIRGFATDTEEAEWVAGSCRTLLSRGATIGDLVVLFRTASLSPVLERAFSRFGVPATVQGAPRFWDLQETMAVAGLIALATNPADSELLYLAFKPGRRRDQLIEWTRNMAGMPLKNLAPSAARAIEEYPPPGLSAERLGLWLDSAGQAGNEALRFPDVASFLAFVRTERAAPRDGSREGIPLMSIHGAKGLEWSGVFVCGCEAHLMPHHRTSDLEEERRVLYVAMTRARRFVSLSYARERFSKGQSPSIFLHDIADRSTGKTVNWSGRPARPSQG
jgi:DNA helicase II / ATP-dependent DNA helicase PcrA